MKIVNGVIQDIIIKYIQNDVLMTLVNVANVNSLIAYMLLEIGIKYKVVGIIMLVL